ncbi:MAG: dCTP deaminase [Candidatus Diapherotrites archaeon]|nr:dCTP deaminase [Candidatus Diapherotrites archaeon]
MIICGESLKEKINSKEIVISPLDEFMVQPASIDLRLSNEFLLVDDNSVSLIDFEKEIKYKKIIAKEFVLPPKSFVLAKTQEHVEIPLNLTAFVEGRSSVGRMGLFIQNAGWIDSGFKGTITLELFNANSLPIKLIAGKRICQIVFMKLDKTLSKGYCGKYQNQKEVTGSRIHSEEK